MKRLLILAAALTLSACAPALKVVQNEAGTLSRGVGEQILLTNPGPSPMLAPTVRLEGPGLKFGTDKEPSKFCDLTGADPIRGTVIWHCGTDAKPIADVPVGGFASLTPTAGHVTIGSATFKREGRFLAIRIELP